jgi:hypothetical protein
MSYREGGYRNKTRWVGVVFVLLSLGWCASWSLGQRDRTAPDTIEWELLQDSRSGEAFAALKDGYPADFERLKKVVADERVKGATADQVAKRIGLFMMEIDRGTMLAAMRAPHGDLTILRRAEIGMVRELAKSDVPSCARYTLTNSVDTRQRQPDLERRMTAFFVAKLRAAGAARKTPVEHRIPLPTDPQWQEVADLMLAEGLSEDELLAFGDEARLRAAPIPLQCRLGLVFLQAIDRLPGDKSNLFYMGTVKEAAEAAKTAPPTPST